MRGCISFPEAGSAQCLFVLFCCQAAKTRLYANMKGADELDDSRAEAAAVSLQEDSLAELMQELRASGVPEERVRQFEEKLRRDIIEVLQQKLTAEQRQQRRLQRRIKELQV